MNPIEEITLVDISINKDNSVLAYYDDRNSEEIITYIQADGKIKFPRNSYGLFEHGSVLTEFIGLENVDTSDVEIMVGMFHGNRSLTSLDLSHFDTSNVRYMNGMFAGCSSLTSLNISGWDLTQISDFDLGGVTSSLESIDASNVVLGTGGLAFSGEKLTSIDLSNINTENVVNMSGMFLGCSSLTSLDVSNFNTANVTDMSGMFSGCSSLTDLNLSNFNTSNVTDMSLMFLDCSSLTSLDISTFNTNNVTNMSGMFYNCSNLAEIIYGEYFVLKSGSTTTDMFLNCPANKPTHESWEGVTF